MQTDFLFFNAHIYHIWTVTENGHQGVVVQPGNQQGISNPPPGYGNPSPGYGNPPPGYGNPPPGYNQAPAPY